MEINRLYGIFSGKLPISPFVENVYFTADHHFGHKNIIEYANRPFRDVGQMEDALIKNWNAVVGLHDLVVHLGDLSLGSADSIRNIVACLNGNIVMVTPEWHHDKRWLPDLERMQLHSRNGNYILYVGPMALLRVDIGEEYPLPITLCHYPMQEWEASYHGSIHLHGHSHGKLEPKKNRFDVGVDCNGFAPVELKEILERISK